ncbi:MAG: hypothetical protein R3180_00250 [Marinobacter sp.]|nr:hypothetical protein [Marinobacter sp.]
MKAKTRVIIEAVIARLAAVTAGPESVHTFVQVEGGQRTFDTTELDSGVCVCVAYAGTGLSSKAAGAPQQISEMSLVIEAHKYKTADADIQAEGLDLLADLQRAVLGDTTYLDQTQSMRRGLLVESEAIEISEDGAAIVATSVVNIPFITQYAKPHQE